MSKNAADRPYLNTFLTHDTIASLAIHDPEGLLNEAGYRSPRVENLVRFAIKHAVATIAEATILAPVVPITTTTKAAKRAAAREATVAREAAAAKSQATALRKLAFIAAGTTDRDGKPVSYADACVAMGTTTAKAAKELALA